MTPKMEETGTEVVVVKMKWKEGECVCPWEEGAWLLAQGRALRQGYCSCLSVTKEEACLPLGLHIYRVNL